MPFLVVTSSRGLLFIPPWSRYNIIIITRLTVRVFIAKCRLTVRMFIAQCRLTVRVFIAQCRLTVSYPSMQADSELSLNAD